MSVDIIFKFKNIIWTFLIAGILLLTVVAVLNPNQSQQIFSTMTLIGVLFIGIFCILVFFKYYQER